MYLRSNLLWPTLACAACLLAFVACMNAGEGFNLHSTWEQELIHAYNSDVTFSSDDALISAGAELDRDLQLLHVNAELSKLRANAELFTLIAQLKQHEHGYSVTYYKPPIVYKPWNSLHWSPSKLATAMMEHFKASHRNIGVLNDNTVITSNLYRRTESNPSLMWGLGQEESHILFWGLSADKTEVTFKGLVTIAPAALIKHIITRVPKLIPDPTQRFDSARFVFRKPNRLSLGIPLVLKPVEKVG